MMRIILFSFGVLTLLLVGSMPPLLHGQDREVHARILPAPIYPPDGSVDQYFADQFVFFEDKTLDLILAYPSAPGSPRTVHRVELPTHVAPEVVATVSKTPPGGYRYSYVVINGPTARQPIRTWFLPVPRPEAPDPTKAVPQDESKTGTWDQNFYSFQPGEWAIRFDSRPGRLIAASQLDSFVVDSENRPGIVSAYFQGAVSSANPIPEDLPQAAREQMEQLQRLEYNSRAIWTIGPKYGRAVSSVEIAADFHFGFSRLVLGRVLDRDSPFVKAVLARLEEFIERPRPQDAAPMVDEPFQPIGQSPNSLSSVEQQLDAALKLALVRP